MTTATLNLSEWQTATPDTHRELAGVELGGCEAKQLAKLLADKLEILELADGVSVRTTSYVGSVTVGNLRVTIRPKLGVEHLLRLFRYAYSLRNLAFYKTFEYDSAKMLFQDLLISQLAMEADELIRRGIRREYARIREPQVNPLGKIDMQEMAQVQYASTATLPCIHHPRLSDCLINRALLAGVHMARAMTSDTYLKGKLPRVLEEDVAVCELSYDLLRQADRAMNRLSRSYQPAMNLVRILYDSGGIEGNDCKRIPLSGFLFDMNRFFQALLSRFLRENLAGYEVADEHRLKHMMSFVADMNPKRRFAPTPRPDFAIRREHKLVALLDAKYRDLWETPLPREMLYQLAIYSLSMAENRISIILYPTTDTTSRDAAIAVHDPTSHHSDAHVVIRPVVLPVLDEVIHQHMHSARGRRECQKLAAQLALPPVKLLR